MTITRGRPKYIGVLRSPPKGQETRKTHTHSYDPTRSTKSSMGEQPSPAQIMDQKENV